MNAWKKYGAVFMAGILLAGGAAGAGALFGGDTAQAEEQKEVTLMIAGEDEEDADKASGEKKDDEDDQSDDEKKDDADDKSDEKTDDADDQSDDGKKDDADDKSDDKKDDADDKSDDADDKSEDENADDAEVFDAIPVVEADEDAIITTDVSNIVENSMPSIVSVISESVEEVQTYYYGVQEFEATEAGSGIIVAQNDEELLIATNSHVVDEAQELTVGFTVEAEDEENLVVPAKIKGMDKNYELAVLAVRLEDIDEDVREQLKIATLGSSEDLKVGQAAVAIGNALGYGQSVTCGIISALDREVTIDNFSKELILTDASINLGNSGGALLNSRGQVVGINVAKESGDSAEGMGYSIPIDTAIPVLKNLINKETRDQMDNSERGYLGATVVDVSSDAKELYNMPEGAFVYEVNEDSAAEEAGIRKGDVITKFDGESVTGKDDLIDKMCYYAVGETVTLEVQTANGGEYESREVEVTLQKSTLPAEETDDGDDSDDAPEDDRLENGEIPEFDMPEDEAYGFFPFGNGGF